MKVQICVGSSCHLKGSEDVIYRLQDLINEYHLINEVELCGAFCLGRCAEGVSMIIDGEPVQNANKDTIDDIFKERILAKIEK